jgi:hypothetical protein
VKSTANGENKYGGDKNHLLRCSVAFQEGREKDPDSLVIKKSEDGCLLRCYTMQSGRY